MTRDTIFRLYSMTKPVVSHGADDALRRRPVPADRSRSRAGSPHSPNVKVRDADGSLRGAEAADADPRRADPHQRPRLQLPTEDAGRGALSRAQDRRRRESRSPRRSTTSRNCRSPSIPARAGTTASASMSPARLIEAISGKPLADVLQRAPVRSAGHGRHRLLRRRKSKRGRARRHATAAPIRLTLTALLHSARAIGRAGVERARRSLEDLSRRRAEDVSARRPRPVRHDGAITSASPRCSATAANSRDAASSAARRCSSCTATFLPPSMLPMRDSTACRLPGYGFGLGSRVRLMSRRPASAGSVGEFGWSGAAKTFYWVDPVEQVVGRVHDAIALELRSARAGPGGDRLWRDRRLAPARYRRLASARVRG